MAAMATEPFGPSNSKCLSCIPYRAAVLTIAGLTMLASVCDIIFGAVGGRVHYHSCNSYSCYSYSYYVWFAWTSIGQGIFGFLMSILLLIGILKRVQGLVLTYIIGMIVNSLGYFGNGAVMLTQLHWYGASVYYGVWAMFWSIIILYFVTVVASFRTWMMQQRAVGCVTAYPQYLQTVPTQGIMMQPGAVINQQGVSTVSGQIGYTQGTQMSPAVQPHHGTEMSLGVQPQHGTQMYPGVQPQHGTQMFPGVQPQSRGESSPEPSSLLQTGDSSQQNNSSESRGDLKTVDD